MAGEHSWMRQHVPLIVIVALQRKYLTGPCTPKLAAVPPYPAWQRDMRLRL